MDTPIHEVLRKSAQTRQKEEALRKDVKLYGWMGNQDGLTLQHAFLYTERKLEAITKLVEDTQHAHYDAIHWLKTTALPQSSHIQQLCAYSSDSDPLSSEAESAARRAELRERLAHHADELMSRVDSFSKSECTAFIRELIERHNFVRPQLSDSISAFLSRVKDHQLDTLKMDSIGRQHLVHSTCLAWTEALLARERKGVLLAMAATEAQRFQQGLLESLRPDEEDEDARASLKERAEEIDDLRHGLLVQLQIADESAMLKFYYSSMLSALEKSTESMLALRQSQWKKDLQAANTSFGNLKGLHLDLNTASFLQAEDAARRNTVADHAALATVSWSEKMAPFLLRCQTLEKTLQQSVATHESRALLCTKECLQSLLKPGTTGSLPRAFFEAFVETEPVQPLLKRALQLLRTLEQPDVPVKEMLRRLDTYILTSSDSIPYEKIDAFVLTLHCASLLLGLT